MVLLTGRESADSLVEKLSVVSNDFSEDHRQFQEAIDYFRNSLSKDATPSVEDLLDAIYGPITSQLVFAGHLGFQANIDHFTNPVARTFMDVDPEVYLLEAMAKTLPEYAAAQGIIDSFYNQLSSEQKANYERVSVYIAHLEALVPKIAHYKGFMLGNELLHYVMPSYHPDAQLTVRYSRMLKEFLQFLPSEKG